MDAEAPQNPTPYRWTKKRHEAAQLLAADELTDQEIADRLGVNRWTVWKWKKAPEFAARVAHLAAELGEVARRYAVGRRARRVAWLEDRLARMRRLIEERSREHADAPGGDTGLVVREVKQIGGGEFAREVEEYRADTALLRELREHEKQAAIELGQWTERREQSNPELDALIAAELARIAGGGEVASLGAPPPDPSPPTPPGP